MSDQFTGLAVKTATGEFVKTKVVDTAGTNELAVNGSGQVTESNSSSIATNTSNTAARLPAAFTSGGGVKVGLTDALPAGTNNIGDVDVLSLPALPAGDNNIGNVDVVTLPSLPAGTNNIGDVDIASALPAGDNNIGNVDIASALPAGTNNIGDVDIASASFAAAADGTTAPAQAVQVGGVDGSGNLQALKVDANGALHVNSTAVSATFKTSNLLTQADLAAGSTVRLGAAALTATATLQKVTVSSAKPLKVNIRKAAAGVDTNLGTGDDVITEHAAVFTKAGESFTYEIEGGFTGASGERFEVLVKNVDNSGASDVYATINWKE